MSTITEAELREKSDDNWIDVNGQVDTILILPTALAFATYEGLQVLENAAPPFSQSFKHGRTRIWFNPIHGWDVVCRRIVWKP